MNHKVPSISSALGPNALEMEWFGAQHMNFNNLCKNTAPSMSCVQQKLSKSFHECLQECSTGCQRSARISGAVALTPTPSGSGEADIARASQVQHAIEDVGGDVHLGRPTLIRMRA